jgi:hypothetical protein
MSDIDKEEQLAEMIEEMYEEYTESGFDFTTEQSLDEIFKGIFTDAVNMTVAVLDSLEEEEDEEPEPPMAA